MVLILVSMERGCPHLYTGSKFRVIWPSVLIIWRGVATTPLQKICLGITLRITRVKYQLYYLQYIACRSVDIGESWGSGSTMGNGEQGNMLVEGVKYHPGCYLKYIGPACLCYWRLARVIFNTVETACYLLKIAWEIFNTYVILHAMYWK